ncbi:hypothetical protein JHL18_12720 [Clostridium sp. YIM B02505]|uniref:Uncharacterized protein n=1 Tax=Clostridium yunnanense TaxID=2800325 RepID=A0ABS1EQ83_9CLOT|nr:hypothetical protein [Clostridium yunnanense]MBK1811484.1 hypothetical protein [Clostridium yunnanense]
MYFLDKLIKFFEGRDWYITFFTIATWILLLLLVIYTIAELILLIFKVKYKDESFILEVKQLKCKKSDK